VAAVEAVAEPESALCHRKIIHRVQKICLPLAVVPPDAVDFRRELKFLKLNVPEI